MSRTEITTVTEAALYINTLTPVTQLVILSGHSKFISIFLNTSIDSSVLAQVTDSDATQLREIGKEFSAAEKMFLLYALCLNHLNKLSQEELKALAAHFLAIILKLDSDLLIEL
jgi:hypothetical protein